jgi:hypothetical protein
MNLNSFFQGSVSIFCITATIFMIMLFIWALKVNAQINKLIAELQKIAITVEAASIDVKGFIDRTITALEKLKESLLTFEFIRKITTEVITMIKGKKKE